MFIFANFLSAFAYIIDTLLTIYMWIIIIRALISWVNPDPFNPLVSFLYRATDPLLFRVRRAMPDLGGIDLSPMVVILVIIFLQRFVVNSLFDLVSRLKFGIGG
jgi:YggT family protein